MKGKAFSAYAHLIALAVLAFLRTGPVAPAGPAAPGGLVLPAPVLALGVGLGGTIAPLFATVLTGVTPAETGSASGPLGAVQRWPAGVATPWPPSTPPPASRPPTAWR